MDRVDDMSTLGIITISVLIMTISALGERVFDQCVFNSVCVRVALSLLIREKHRLSRDVISIN